MSKRNVTAEVGALLAPWYAGISEELSRVEELKTEVERLRRIIAGFMPVINRTEDNALFILALDTSGSMGPFEKAVAKEVNADITGVISAAGYKKFSAHYVGYHIEAREVDEATLFSKGNSGGTITSTGYVEINRIINEYPTHDYDVYVLNISDGDNLTSDNERCLRWINDILPKVRSFDYVEINQYSRSSPLMSSYRNVKLPKFRTTVIRERSDVYTAVRSILSEVDGNDNGKV